MNAADVAMARRWAEFYRARGFNPLPSRPDDKRPLIRYADLWESPAPADSFDRHPTANIQVMTGRAWRLLVIDLDGPEAAERWATLGRTPRTWVTHSGGGGRHLWFRLPAAYARPLPKAFLWRGEGKHSAIERLCDHSLVMAPPSIHPRTGERYRFLGRAHSPASVPLPADCPAWVLALAPIDRPAGAPRPRRLPDLPFLGDRVELARRWGLRVAGKERKSGWVPCHAIDRDDEHPSAAIHAESGFYVDAGSGVRLRFAELAVALHAFPTVEDALRELGGNRVRCA